MPISPHIKSLRAKVGKDLLLLPGVTALVFNDVGEVLLGKRTDNGRWAVIGGVVDPGEEPATTAVREVLEETGVECVVERVSGIYLTPVTTYPNGDVAQYILTAFRCRMVGGEPRVNDDESTAVQFFALHDLPESLTDEHQLRILHAASAEPHPAFFFNPGDGEIESADD